MKKSGLIIFFMAHNSLFSQDSTYLAHGIKFLFGISAAPILNHTKNQKENFNISSGVLTSVNFDSYLEIKTGILSDFKKYSVTEFHYDNSFPTGKKVIDTSYSFRYFRIPVIYNIYFKRNAPMLLYSSLGFIIGIGMDKFQNYFIDYSGRGNGTFHFGIGVKYLLSQKVNFNIEPFINRFAHQPIQEYIVPIYSPPPSPSSGFHSGGSAYITRYIESVNSRNAYGINISVNYVIN